MRISDWSSDVCSSDLPPGPGRSDDPLRARPREDQRRSARQHGADAARAGRDRPRLTLARLTLVSLPFKGRVGAGMGWSRLGCGISRRVTRSEEHTSELQSLMRISYAVFCLKKKKLKVNNH